MAKARSIIVSKFQTTVPPTVRDRFDLREGDLLEWDFEPEKGVLVVRPMRANLIPPRGVVAIQNALRASQEGRTTEVSAEILQKQPKTELA